MINLTNNWYKIIVDQKGKIAVKNREGKVIVSGLTFYAEFKGEKGSWGLHNIFVKKVNDSCVEINGTGPRNTNVNLLIIKTDLPRIDIRTKINYNTRSIGQRESLVAAFVLPVTEVDRKNRTVDTANFEPEYWLQKEGVRFGSGETSALI